MNDGDSPAVLLTAQALREAEELAEVGDPDEDVRVAHLLGTFHWYRYLALPAGRDREALVAAVRFLYPVYLAHPEAVPDELCAMFAAVEASDEFGAASSVAAAVEAAGELYQAYRRSGDPAQLREAVALLREAVAEAPSDDPDYPACLSNLALLLRTLAELTEDDALLAEAVEIGRRAVAATAGDPSTHAKCLSMLGLALRSLHGRTEDPAVLAEAVEVGRRAVAASPAGSPDHRSGLSNLGLSLRFQAASSDSTDLFAEAVEVSRQAVTGGPRDVPERVGHLVNLAIALQELFERNGDEALLAEAVPVCREAVALAGPDHPHHGDVMRALTAVLRSLSSPSGPADALVDAVEVARHAVVDLPDGHPYRARLLADMAVAACALAALIEEPGLLAAAVAVCREALALAAPGHPHHNDVLAALTAVLQALSEQTGPADALADAVDLTRRALADLPEDHPQRVRLLADLALALHALAVRTGEPGLLAEAVPVCREAVALAGPDHPHHNDVLAALTAVLQALSEQAGPAGPPAEAVEITRRAVARVPHGHPHRAALLNNLGLALRALFDRTGEPPLLAEAEEVCREALAATPEDSPDLTGRWNNLALVLRARSEQDGDVDRLAEAVAASRRTVELTPADSPELAGRMNNLSVALRTLAKRTGDVVPLTEAVGITRRVVALARDDDPYLPSYLSNLGLALRALAERTGDTTALAEAADVSRRAVRSSAPDHPHRAGHLSYLGLVLLELARRTGDVDLLMEAMEVATDAVAELPEDHPERAAYLNNLSAVLHAGTPETRAWAVELSREAVALTPADDPSYTRRVSNLGGLLQELAEQNGDLGLLVEAVAVGRRALAGTPEDHPQHASFQSNLGHALRALADHTGERTLAAEALERFRSAGRSTAGEVLVRVQALREVAVLASGTAEALAAVETAVGLLPQISPRTLTDDDRRHQVRRLGSLAGVAAAAALNAGRPGRAVELLEATRGTLAAGTIDARGDDLVRLAAHHEELAREFTALRERIDALDSPAVGPVPSLDTEPRAADTVRVAAAGQDAAGIVLARRLAHAEWERLVERIRAVDGFADFLRPPLLADLTGIAESGDRGPLVFLTAGPDRCDALILGSAGPDEVRVVPLPGLTEREATARAEQLAAARRTATDRDRPLMARRAAQFEILDLLGWLWDAVAEPVLTALGVTGAPADGAPFPRIWWCPVGVMCYLPVHAAGHHRDLTSDDPLLAGAPRTVLDRAVSSYTPTARALTYARSHQPPPLERALIVAVPDAPGARPLPGAAAEADAVHALLPGALRPEHPLRADVLAALPGHPLAHFSCHGLADARDPGSSRLILHDHRSAPLTVADIGALRLTGSLAFLSACDTSATSPQLADEAVHLTGAFHLAGYRNVIGTLWPVDDATAADLAVDFYAHLTSDGAAAPDTAASARALHRAVRALREYFPLAPTHWAAHTHTGP
ncbi:CHAT domain-containing protein [Kitasatospora sp. NPDC004531]